MITVYKFLKVFDKVNCEQFFNRVEGDRTRGHNMKLKKMVVKREVRRHFFSARVVDKWNSLDRRIVEAKSIHSFKARYDKK